MRGILRRIATLETRQRLNFPQRVIVRYQHEGEPRPEIPEAERDENTLLVIVKYVKMPIIETAVQVAP